MTTLSYRPRFPPGTPVTVAVRQMHALGFEFMNGCRTFGIVRRRKAIQPPKSA